MKHVTKETKLNMHEMSIAHWKLKLHEE